MPATRHWWPAVRGGLEIGATLALLAVLHRTGWAVPGSIWFFAIYFVVGSLSLFALTAATGSVGAGRFGVALNVLFTGSLIYLTGWGPVMVFSFVLLATYLGDLGRSWRTLLTLSLITVAGGRRPSPRGGSTPTWRPGRPRWSARSACSARR